MTYRPLAPLTNVELAIEYVMVCIREKLDVDDIGSHFTTGDVITEALARGMTMDDLEGLAISEGY